MLLNNNVVVHLALKPWLRYHQCLKHASPQVVFLRLALLIRLLGKLLAVHELFFDGVQHYLTLRDGEDGVANEKTAEDLRVQIIYHSVVFRSFE